MTINRTKGMTDKEWKEFRENIFSRFRNLRRTNSHEYPRLCLKLQREVRDIDPMFLTANAAMMATPPQYQVTKQSDLKRGMIAYSADFNDSNTADHIYSIAGTGKSGKIITWSNDVRETGAVDQVFIDFYRDQWGDPFRFGSWWLNGVYFGPPEKEKPKAALGPHYENVLHQLVRIRNNKAKSDRPGSKKLAEMLTADIKTMRNRLNDWST